MLIKMNLLCFIVFLFSINILVNGAALKELNSSEICITQECVETAALITTSIDDSVNPCDDFYEYACGNWKKEHFVQSGVKSYGYSHFHKLNSKMLNTLLTLLRNGYQPHQSNVLQKLFKFYDKCTNMAGRNKTSLNTLRKLVHALGGWPTIDSNWKQDNYTWEKAYATMNQIYSFSYPFGLQVFPDVKNTSRNILILSTSYTRFSSIDSIIEEEPKYPKIGDFDVFDTPIDKFQRIAQVLKGSPLDAKTWTNDRKLYNDFVSKLQNASNLVNISDISGYYQYLNDNYDKLLWTVDELKSKTPHIKWDVIFSELFGKKDIGKEKIYVFDPKFIKNFDSIIVNTTKRTLANYINTLATYAFAGQTNEELTKLLDSIPSRNISCTVVVNQQLTDLVSRMYYEKSNIKNDDFITIETMVQNLKESFHNLLDENTWMDPETKKHAKEKLSAIQPHILAPDIVKNVSALEKNYAEYGEFNDDHLANVLRSFSISRKRELNNLGKNMIKVKGDWPDGIRSAIVVNAFYYALYNGIFFPAGIAQIPFFAANRPMSVNLGSIGVIIGHELTHGFDNAGSMFNHQGNLINWWSNQTKSKFNEKAKCFVDQYSKFRMPGANGTVNGKVSLGENIADNGGIREAYNALKIHKRKHVIPKLPGYLSQLSDEKIFFLSYATQWCANMDTITLQRSLNQTHSPPHARIVLPLSNFEEFAKVFNCPANSKMNPTNKCHLW